MVPNFVRKFPARASLSSNDRGLMQVGSTITSRGLLGLDFTGRVAGETVVEGRRAILPEITGTSYLTGFSQFLFDPNDPLRAGFLLES